MRNMVGRLKRGQSLLVFGGPKLGKTSLLLQLRWLLAHSGSSGTSRQAETQAVQYWDVQDESVWPRILAGPLDGATILLLDNCDRLAGTLTSRERHLIQGRQNGGPARAVVWAGGRAWHDFARRQEFHPAHHPVPLAVLLEREARELLTGVVSPDQVSWILSMAGTHPYILKVLSTGVASFDHVSGKAASDRLLGEVRAKLAPFFMACLQGLREPVERRLLDSLVDRGGPTNPREAARTLGLPTVKPAADTLCCLGLISRWNLTDGAALQAGCRLFNDWYLTHQSNHTPIV